MMQDEKKFGLLRSILWPIHRSEFKKVTSMLILIFLLCSSYSILRNLKDTIILTAKHSGAEVIPFLKIWGMLPGAIIATWCYTRLARRFSKETVFYLTIGGFLTYFLIFAFLLHPYSEALHLDSLGDWLGIHLPAGFGGFIAMIRNWTFSTFYIASELWAPVMLGILFWGFVNDKTEVSQAKRTYGILNVGSNIAPMIGGSLAYLCNHLTFTSSSNHADSWSQTLTAIILMLVFLCVASMGVFYWINRKVIQPEAPLEKQQIIEERQKNRLSIRESIRYIAKSKYLTCLALIVLGFNISINFTDVLWKAQLKQVFPNPKDMLNHMSLLNIGIGVIGTIGGTLFSLMVNRLGWTFTALLTPAVMFVMAIGFFVFLFCGDSLTPLAVTLFGTTSLTLTAYFGSLQYCLSKAGKYSVFDASKELAFLTLSNDSKVKGKAAIDGLGSAIGKSGASVTYQGLLIFLGSVAASTPFVCAILFIVLIAWIASSVSLGNLFLKESSKETASKSV